MAAAPQQRVLLLLLQSGMQGRLTSWGGFSSFFFSFFRRPGPVAFCQAMLGVVGWLLLCPGSRVHNAQWHLGSR